MSDEWDDYNAEIEDTVRCQNCHCQMTLGGNDHVIVEVPNPLYPQVVNQIVLCIECAAAVHDAYLQACRDAGVCEHGVNDGEWCEDCLKAYKAARKEYGDEC